MSPTNVTVILDRVRQLELAADKARLDWRYQEMASLRFQAIIF